MLFRIKEQRTFDGNSCSVLKEYARIMIRLAYSMPSFHGDGYHSVLDRIDHAFTGSG